MTFECQLYYFLTKIGVSELHMGSLIDFQKSKFKRGFYLKLWNRRWSTRRIFSLKRTFIRSHRRKRDNYPKRNRRKRNPKSSQLTRFNFPTTNFNNQSRFRKQIRVKRHQNQKTKPTKIFSHWFLWVACVKARRNQRRRRLCNVKGVWRKTIGRNWKWKSKRN